MCALCGIYTYPKGAAEVTHGGSGAAASQK